MKGALAALIIAAIVCGGCSQRGTGLPDRDQTIWEAYSFFHVRFATVSDIADTSLTVTECDGTRADIPLPSPPAEPDRCGVVAIVYKDAEAELGTEAGVKAILWPDGPMWCDRDIQVYRGQVRQWQKDWFCTYPITGPDFHDLFEIDIATIYDATTGEDRGLMRDLPIVQPNVSERVKAWPAPWQAWFIEWRWPRDQYWVKVAAVRWNATPPSSED